MGIAYGSLSAHREEAEECCIRETLASTSGGIMIHREERGGHGGQTWYTLKGVIEDLSVTANPLGPSPAGRRAVTEALPEIAHYPPHDWGVAREQLRGFLKVSGDTSATESQLLLGNGASELIDVLMRYLRGSAETYVTGPAPVQYREYELTALRCGMRAAASRRGADVHLLVNPCNPTGFFLPYRELVAYVRRFGRPQSAIVVDESMLPWLGPSWTQESALSDLSWIQELLDDLGIRLFVLHSWTKLWSCSGLRLGSRFCTSEASANDLRALLVPWNVNILALAFLRAAVNEFEYLSRTWEKTRLWRGQFRTALEAAGEGWTAHGERWLPWIWLDVVESETARRFVEASAECGLPVRPGAMGYEQPSFVRVRVCSPARQRVLLRALRKRRVAA